MKLSTAKSIAESIAREMSPFCAKVLIAGSIRREKPEVKDIEIVAVPYFEHSLFPSGNLFEPEITVSKNLLFDWANNQTRVRWIKPGTSEIIPWQPKEDGKYWRGLVAADGEEIKLDLFIAKPENFGVISTIRTGSAAFSQSLVTIIKHQTPFRVEGGNLTRKSSGEIIECPTEESFFQNAGIVFVPVQIRSAENPFQILHLLRS